MRRARLSGALCALVLANALAIAQTPGGSFADPLRACAAIAPEAERLACYDRIAGRPAPSPTEAVSPAAAAALPTSATPPTPAAAAPAPAAGSAAIGAAAVGAVQSRNAAALPAASATPLSARPPPTAQPQSFGLYSAEHPKPPPAPSALSARVIGVGSSPDGHQTVALEGGALWQLDEGDPLLAVGDTVTISRGALGSFLLQTPSERVHHVRRLH